MKEAHRMRAITGMSMSESLKKAWMNEKLSVAMKERICHFFYQKISGEVREAYGSMMSEHIEGKVNGNGRRGADCKTYWDTTKGAFRCYKSYNIISFA